MEPSDVTPPEWLTWYIRREAEMEVPYALLSDQAAEAQKRNEDMLAALTDLTALADLTENYDEAPADTEFMTRVVKITTEMNSIDDPVIEPIWDRYKRLLDEGKYDTLCVKLKDIQTRLRFHEEVELTGISSEDDQAEVWKVIQILNFQQRLLAAILNEERLLGAAGPWLRSAPAGEAKSKRTAVRAGRRYYDYTWMVKEYSKARPDYPSDTAARQAVCERYFDEHGEHPSESSVRRAVEDAQLAARARGGQPEDEEE